MRTSAAVVDSAIECAEGVLRTGKSRRDLGEVLHACGGHVLQWVWCALEYEVRDLTVYLHRCHPDTNSFVTAREFGTRNGSKSEIVVSICPSTCHLFYEACSDFAASRNIFDETEFCENWTHKDVFQFDDDDDNDDGKSAVKLLWPDLSARFIC